MKESLNNHQHWMKLALEQAKLAQQKGEVPVGAVLVFKGELIGAGHNSVINNHDASAHAEIVALRQAGQALKNYRLEDCTLYVTLEPCPMCAMALLHARVDTVVYGAADPKTGAAGSVINLFNQPQLNHHTQYCGGMMEEECRALLRDFFTKKRQERSLQHTPLREDALRTAEERFKGLNGLGEGEYAHAFSALNGLRLHYHHLPPIADEALAQPKDEALLLLHGSEGFSDQYADVVEPLQRSGYELLLPDLIGFGRSDKPKKEAWHTLSQQADYLQELLMLRVSENYSIVAPVEARALLVELMNKMEATLKALLKKIVLIEHLPALSVGQQTAPYPDAGYTRGAKAFVRLLAQQQGGADLGSLGVQIEQVTTLTFCVEQLIA